MSDATEEVVGFEPDDHPDHNEGDEAVLDLPEAPDDVDNDEDPEADAEDVPDDLLPDVLDVEDGAED